MMSGRTWRTIVMILAVLAAVTAAAGPAGAAAVKPAGAPVMEDYCIIPPFIGKTAPPLIMMLLQKDHKLFRKAYDDYSDIDNDGYREITYEHNTGNFYYGYFDPIKCYQYDSANGRFSPTRISNLDWLGRPNGRCGGAGEWSGNFLNWATMTRLDVMRKVFYGGYRFSQNASGAEPHTVLERAFLPQDGHSFVKRFWGDVTDFTPYGTQSATPLNSLVMCNTTRDSTGNPPLMRVATTDGTDWFEEDRWSAHERWQCAYQDELVSEGAEVPINGSFDFDTAGWTANNVTAAIVPGGVSGSALEITESAITNTTGTFFINAPTAVGQHYRFSMYAKRGTTDYAYTILYSPSPYAWYDSVSHWDSVWTKHVMTFQATQPETRIEIYVQDWDGIPSETFFFDELELVELAELKPLALVSESERPDPGAYNDPDAGDRGNKIQDFTVRVEACLSGLIGSENCYQYEQFGNFMPGGLFQKYGHDESMYFGLITGSFRKNKSGGKLRNKMEDIGSTSSAAINRTTGLFTAVGTGGGVLSTLNEMDVARYSYATGTYDGDNCPSGTSGFLDENNVADAQCSNWGNPMGEIFYEGLRFFSGKDKATAKYNFTGADIVTLADEAWSTLVDPYDEPYVEECNKAFNLIISDEFPSYDSDQLPGASFPMDSGSYYSASGDDLSLDVTALTHQVAQMEGIYNGATYFVGDNGVTSDGLCTAKSVTNLGQVRGLCPGEGGQEGSYALAGLAYYGKTTDVRPDNDATIGKAGDQDVTTYAISLGKGIPELNMSLGGQRISVIPSCYNHKTGKSCTFVDMRVSWQWQYGGGVMISWDEDHQGGDYDMDVIQYLNWEAWDSDGDTVYDSIRVYTSRWWIPDDYTFTDTVTFGYAITGVAGAGVYHDVIMNEDPALDLWSYDPVTFERLDVPDGVTDTCGDGMYDWEWPLGDCRAERYFTPGASTARFLQSPLWLAAKYGGFEDIDDDGTPNLATEWDLNSDGRPDTYFDASNIGKLEERLEDAFSAILRRVTSGTAASVLASGEGSGANLVQAVYYPRRRFATREVKWLGSLQNLWYYVDPYFQNSTIREDSNKDKILDLTEDLIVHMFYDPAAGSTSAYLYEDNDGSGGPDPNYDSDGDGVNDTALAVDVKSFSAMNTLWQAGNKLWARDPGTRAIYFYNGVTPIPYPLPILNTGQTAALAPLMGLAGQTDKASDVIKFTQGYELVFVDRDGDGDHDYRRRTADVDLNGDGDTLDAGERNEWKLGDIIDSTPRISSHLPLHFYDKTYGDDTYRADDGTYGYLTTDVYDRHGLVFTGANDGMLHAFRMGDLQMSDDPDWVAPAPQDFDIARLAGTDLGREEWAFIPMNILPYLQYIAEDDYCHLISVDLSPYVFDASINRDPVDRDGNLQPGACTDSNYWNCLKTENSWRTIIIGGLRFGGACRNRDYDCDGKDCSNVPVRTTVDGVANTDVGYSVYFALDVTHQYDAAGNPQAPRLLWEFAHDEMGVSSTGPAIVRINGWDDANGNGVQDAGENEDNTGLTRNGRWLVVIGSGPTGPITPNDHQFLGKSDQNLKFFVLDLKSGQLLTTDGLGSPAPIDTGVPYAFAGSMINVTHDAGLANYEDEALYVGYTYTDDSNPTSTSVWHNGGVGRIVTNGSADPNDWVWSVVIDDVGPVTAAPAKLENTRSGKIWVFFGAGRFFYKQLDVVDDMADTRSLYGVVDKCFSGGNFLAACSNSDPADDAGVQTSKAELNDSTDVNNASNDPDGWYIDMEAAVDLDGDNKLDIGAERDISDVVASTTGLVFFTTFTPYVSACTLGGKSYIWATDYATGGDPGARLIGKGLVQVSTGAIEEVDLKSAFNEKGGRRTGAMEGVPPTGGALNLQAPPVPEKRVIHVLEK